MWNIGLPSQSEYAVPMLFNDFNIKVQFFVHKFAIIAWKYKMWCKSLLGINLPRSWHTRRRTQPEYWLSATVISAMKIIFLNQNSDDSFRNWFLTFQILIFSHMKLQGGLTHQNTSLYWYTLHKWLTIICPIFMSTYCGLTPF